MASSAEIQPLALPAMQHALASSVSGGIFADTAYQLYSQRQKSRKIGKPRVVYGSSIVMKAVSSHFRTREWGPCIQDSQRTNGPTVEPEKATAEKELPAETEEYDYDSDSDLDESEDERDMKDFEELLSDSTATPRGLSPTWSDLESIDVRNSVGPFDNYPSTCS